MCRSNRFLFFLERLFPFSCICYYPKTISDLHDHGLLRRQAPFYWWETESHVAPLGTASPAVLRLWTQCQGSRSRQFTFDPCAGCSSHSAPNQVRIVSLSGGLQPPPQNISAMGGAHINEACCRAQYSGQGAVALNWGDGGRS